MISAWTISCSCLQPFHQGHAAWPGILILEVLIGDLYKKYREKKIIMIILIPPPKNLQNILYNLIPCAKNFPNHVVSQKWFKSILGRNKSLLPVPLNLRKKQIFDAKFKFWYALFYNILFSFLQYIAPCISWGINFLLKNSINM